MKKSNNNCCKTVMKPLQRMGNFLNHNHWRLNLNHCHWTPITVTFARPFFEGENYALFPCYTLGNKEAAFIPVCATI